MYSVVKHGLSKSFGHGSFRCPEIFKQFYHFLWGWLFDWHSSIVVCYWECWSYGQVDLVHQTCHSCIIVSIMVTAQLVFLTLAAEWTGAQPQGFQSDLFSSFSPSSLVPVFNISLSRGCLQCGSSCLTSVQTAVPGCVAAGLLDVGPCNFRNSLKLFTWFIFSNVPMC